MPCSDNQDWGEPVQMKAALDYATRVACELGAIVVLCNLWEDLSEDAKNWLKHHEQMDKQRRSG